jgi:geranylgeranyl diphosphate synthase, type I
MNLAEFSAEVRPSIETELQKVINGIDKNKFYELRRMLSYHMGWEGEGAGEKARGKRIRPLLVLLATTAVGQNWREALPAAAAVELIHNFSLIHDDIEDRSDYRHGRKTVWSIWGEAQAINAGDCMFSLAFKALSANPCKPENTVKAMQILQETCVTLTEGQFLDMAFESTNDLPLDNYWTMVGGKTAALLACSASIGATMTGAETRYSRALHEFAWNLGLAFQAQDDWLGIWGDSALIGKSTDSDLYSGKKSLPVIFGLKESSEFRKRWKNRPFTEVDIPVLASILKDDGIQQMVEKETARLTVDAKNALSGLPDHNIYVDILFELADVLLGRKK